jgi:hypothetical protein
MSDELLQTSIDSFLGLVRQKRQVGLAEAAAALKETEDTIERWALILDKKGLVKMVYPENPFDKAFVRAPPEAKK